MKKNKTFFYIKKMDNDSLTEQLLFFLKNLEYSIDLYVEDNSDLKLEYKNVNVIKLNLKKNKIINYFKIIKTLLKNKNKYKSGILMGTNTLMGTFFVKKQCIKKTIFINEILNNYSRDFFYNIKIYNYDNIILFNNYEKEIFIKYFPSLTKKVKVINYAIDDKSLIKKSQEKITEKIHNKDINILITCELNEEQNKLLSLLKKLKNITLANRTTKIFIIGDGIDKNAYKAYIEDNNLKKNVFILDNIKNIYPYMKKCQYYLVNEVKLTKYIIESIFFKNTIISFDKLSDENITILPINKLEINEIIELKNKQEKYEFNEINAKKINILKEIINKGE